MSKTISIVSGKGGSGKTLLTAIIGRALAREGQNVLIIDTDIFVRGLTILLQGFRKKKDEDNLISFSEFLGIYETNSRNLAPIEIDIDKLDLSRFFECDLFPAVNSITAPLDYNDKDLSDENFCINRFFYLRDIFQNKYDYILLDNRAGIDSLILASCRVSNFSLAIVEDDPVAKQTNSNLVNHLKYNLNIKNVYTIVNKARNIKYYDDIISRSENRSDFSEIGVIPFDMEILQDFGTDRFWSTVNETLYFRSVIDSWNKLAFFENIQKISEAKYKFPPNIFMKRSQGKYSLIERVLRLYSIVFVLTGIIMWFYPKIKSGDLNFYEITSVISILAGVIVLILSTSNFRKMILGDPSERKNK